MARHVSHELNLELKVFYPKVKDLVELGWLNKLGKKSYFNEKNLKKHLTHIFK